MDLIRESRCGYDTSHDQGAHHTLVHECGKVRLCCCSGLVRTHSSSPTALYLNLEPVAASSGWQLQRLQGQVKWSCLTSMAITQTLRLPRLSNFCLRTQHQT